MHFQSSRLGRDDRNDFKRVRINDHDLVLDEEVIEAAVLRHDPHDFLGQHRVMDAMRNSRPNVYVEVHVAAKPWTVLAPNDRLDLRALVLRQLHRSTASAALADSHAGPAVLLGRVAFVGGAAALLLRTLEVSALFLRALGIGAVLLLSALLVLLQSALLLSALLFLPALFLLRAAAHLFVVSALAEPLVILAAFLLC